jgi:DNA-binding response OmpR family regulator
LNPVEGSELWVLVVEDEPLTRLSLRTALLKDGFKVQEAESGEEALSLFDQIHPQAVILDIGLPGLNGFEVCRRIREKRKDTGILMLTARADTEDKINGLELGADDYLVKPFNPGELVARIRAVLRRSALRPAVEEPLVFGDLRLDFQTLHASKGGVDVNLSPREFALLAALLRHPGKVMSRDQLAKEVWGTAKRGNARALDVFVCKLREKIEDDPARPRYIKTAWGAGYICG